MPKTPTRPINIYRKIAVSFIILTLILVAVVVYFSVVSVKIVIIPNKERTTTSFIVSVKDESNTNPTQGLSVKGIIEGVPVHINDTFKTEGKEVKDTEISGFVTIYNKHTSDQPLIKTTRLLTEDGRLYRLKQTVRVTAGSQVENVAVYADKDDQSMEIAEDKVKMTIPGLWAGLQDKIYAESAGPIKLQELGDTMISAGDLQKAKDNLKTKLLEKVSKLADVKKYKGKDTVIYDISEDKIKFETTAKAGDKVENFTMSASVDAVIVAFDAEDIKSISQIKAEEALPDDKQLESFDRDNFEYSVDRYDIEAKVADLKVEAIAQMILKGGTDIIKPEKLVGLDREQLDDYLSSLREIAGFEVKFTPSWLNKVPSLVDHVKIEIAK